MTTRSVHQRPASTVPMLYRLDAEYYPKRPLDGGTSGNVNHQSAATDAVTSPKLQVSPASVSVYSPRVNGNRTSTSHGGTLVTVSLIKGAGGFGFTLADTSRGQVIKTIVDPARCRDVHPGDVIVGVNGVWLRDRPHSAVVDALRRCDYGRLAELTLLTSSTPRVPPSQQMNVDDVNNGNGSSSFRRDVTDNDVNRYDIRHGLSQSHIDRTQSKRLDGSGIGNRDDSVSSIDRRSAGLTGGGVRRGENGIRIYKSANRAVLNSGDSLGSGLDGSFSGSSTSQVSDIYRRSDAYNGHSLNGGVSTVEPHRDPRQNRRSASSLAVTEHGLSGRIGNVNEDRRSNNDGGLRRSDPPRQRQYVPENGFEGLGLPTSTALGRRPVSTTPMSKTEVEDDRRRQSDESSSAVGSGTAQSSSSNSSRTGRLAAIVRRPITPVLHRRSKSQMRAAAELQERERRRTNTDERPPSTTSLLTRSSSPNSLLNFSGTPDFIPASVYGASPLDGLLRYRSGTDTESNAGCTRQSVSSTGSTPASAARRPPSSVSGYVTDLSASSSVVYSGLPASASASASASSNNYRNMQSVSSASTAIPDVESSSVTDSIGTCSDIFRQTPTMTGCPPNAPTTARLNGGCSSAEQLEDTTTLQHVGTAASKEPLFVGREMCNGYNVRTETIYSSPKHSHPNQRRLNLNRPASTVPHLSCDETQSKLPPTPPVISITGSRPSAVRSRDSSANSARTPAVVIKTSRSAVPSESPELSQLPQRSNCVVDGSTNKMAAAAALDGTETEKNVHRNSDVSSKGWAPSSLPIGRDPVVPLDGNSTGTILAPPKTTMNSAYYDIELHRGSRGFGFSIRGGKEFDGMPLFVLNIAKGGPADMDGRLMNDDQIVAINGVIADSMTHSEAVQLVQNSCSPLHLIVKRLADINSNTTLPADDVITRSRRELPATPAAGSSSLAPSVASTSAFNINRQSVEPVPVPGRKYVASTSRLNDGATMRR